MSFLGDVRPVEWYQHCEQIDEDVRSTVFNVADGDKPPIVGPLRSSLSEPEEPVGNDQQCRAYRSEVVIWNQWDPGDRPYDEQRGHGAENQDESQGSQGSDLFCRGVGASETERQRYAVFGQSTKAMTPGRRLGSARSVCRYEVVGCLCGIARRSLEVTVGNLTVGSNIGDAATNQMCFHFPPLGPVGPRLSSPEVARLDASLNRALPISRSGR